MNRSIFRIGLLVLWLCTVGIGQAQPNESSLVGILDPDGQYAFAMDYYRNGDHHRAVSEFDRFVHFFPDDPRVESAMLFAAQALHREGRASDALKRYRQIVERYSGSQSAVRAGFESADCLMDMNEPGEAKALLLKMAETASSGDIRDEALYRTLWIDVSNARFSEAGRLAGEIGPIGKERYRIPDLQERLDQAGDISRKDPTLSGFLSILPGAGYAYCERYRDAAVAFFLNVAFIAATVEAFRDGNDALGCLVGFVGSGFYMGNIYGGVNAAEKYNRNAIRVFIERTASDFRVDPRTGKSDGVGIQIRSVF
ncbi:MAG: tetratricopeptide repeat protein [Thermodesulfobacteriota bacterium]